MDDNQNTPLPLSIPGWLLGHLGTALIRRGLSPTRSLEERRRWLQQLGRWTTRKPGGLRIETATVGTVPCEWLHPASAAGTDDSSVIVYLHGGGYTLGSLDTHRGLTAHLAQYSHCRVLTVDYRLAPEHPFPAALEDAVAVVQALLEGGLSHHRVVLAGDSAGGGLALACAVAMRDLGLPRVQALCLLSPWADLALTGDSVAALASRERVLSAAWLRECAAAYAGDQLQASLASPLQAELDRLPPCLIQVGSEELLLDDARRLAERFEEAGGACELQVAPDLWHVWPLFAGWMPEANAALQAIGDFIRASRR